MVHARIDAALSLEMARAVEAAAVAVARHAGGGDEQAADVAAAQAMRAALRHVAIRGTVVVGGGPRGAVPALVVGETAGAGGTAVDVAVAALECATRAARGESGSLSVIAIAEPGRMLAAPPVYMQKIAVGPAVASAALDLDAAPADTVRAVAAAIGRAASEMTVCVLDRPRHAALIESVREAGAQVRLIGDGDIAGAMSPALFEPGTDLYLGIGGATEGVLAAAGLRGLGGRMLARLAPRNDDDRARIAAA